MRFDEVIGQEHAKRAFEIALAGNHSVKLIGKNCDTKDLVEVAKTYGIACQAFQPCLCGNAGHPLKSCFCRPFEIRRQEAKIAKYEADLTIDIPPVRSSKIMESLTGKRKEEKDEKVLERVRRAKKITKPNGKYNPEVANLLKCAISQLSFGAFETKQVLEVAKTITQLSNRVELRSEHLAEALQYRPRETGN